MQAQIASIQTSDNEISWKNKHDQPTRFHPDNLAMIPVTNNSTKHILTETKQKYNLATRKNRGKP
ncbi:hypothetical protein OIU79_025254 [Salix purpurea]|uniref:Uncharacterized protein n=1 Tax=Salix purpurea TaxID=77065 RepID=A0A9Q1A764_SALPP|nr:hypothetical protein OIU79_025254 [Salix purpurea]